MRKLFYINIVLYYVFQFIFVYFVPKDSPSIHELKVSMWILMLISLSIHGVMGGLLNNSKATMCLEKYSLIHLVSMVTAFLMSIFIHSVFDYTHSLISAFTILTVCTLTSYWCMSKINTLMNTNNITFCVEIDKLILLKDHTNRIVIRNKIKKLDRFSLFLIVVAVFEIWHLYAIVAIFVGFSALQLINAIIHLIDSKERFKIQFSLYVNYYGLLILSIILFKKLPFILIVMLLSANLLGIHMIGNKVVKKIID